MAGAMRKVGEYLGLVEQADYDDDFDDEPSTPVPVKREPDRRPAVVRPTTVSNIEEHRRGERHTEYGRGPVVRAELRPLPHRDGHPPHVQRRPHGR